MSSTTAVAAKPSSAKKSYPFYFGGAASCVAAIVVHPFDLTKVRLQNTKGSMNHGMFSTMVKIAQNEGFFKLYAGLSASILRQATYSTVRFGVYEKLKDYIQSTTQQSKLNIEKKGVEMGKEEMLDVGGRSKSNILYTLE
ncbi:hypothetical protein G6F42_028177 [Rhizopus arrhizus]|nr:hypothetical protein G6F42_028177 [Rhizopus arrhizus]